MDFRFKLADEIPRLLLAGTSGALAGCLLAIMISIWPTRSSNILERYSFEWDTLSQWALPLMVYGASTAAIVIVVIHAYSNINKNAG